MTKKPFLAYSKQKFYSDEKVETEKGIKLFSQFGAKPVPGGKFYELCAEWELGDTEVIKTSSSGITYSSGQYAGKNVYTITKEVFTGNFEYSEVGELVSATISKVITEAFDGTKEKLGQILISEEVSNGTSIDPQK